MFTTGSKLLLGSAAAAAVFAAVYGIAQEGALGTIGLVSAACALAFLASINLWVRDSNVSAMDHEALESSAAAQATARPSLWPLLIAIGATTLTLGLVTSRAFFMLGLIAMIAGAIEWLISGWSERASGDSVYNADARNLMVDPLEMPVVGAAGAGVVVYAFSRVMLGLPSKTATVIAFSALAAVVLAVGTMIGVKRGASKTAMTGAFSVAAVALIGAGAFAGLNGERETHEHHTTAYIADRDECVDEETDADHHASQTVAIKSNVAAEVTFDGENISADVPGFDGEFDTLTLLRSNPSNVIFRNTSAHEARFVVELHPELEDGEPVGPERLCTALVEEGGAQLLTIEYQRPSFAVEGGYAITVPGSDAELEVTVP